MKVKVKDKERKKEGRGEWAAREMVLYSRSESKSTMGQQQQQKQQVSNTQFNTTTTTQGEERRTRKGGIEGHQNNDCVCVRVCVVCVHHGHGYAQQMKSLTILPFCCLLSVTLVTNSGVVVFNSHSIQA